MRSTQEFIHWLEAGTGARWLRRSAIVAAVLALSLLMAWKQFHGPATEATLEQADVGRQLAEGKGFATRINHPQSAALLESRGQRFDSQSLFPELHHAPLYSTVIGAGLRLVPAAQRAQMFRVSDEVADGFGGDYFLLGINLVLFWLAAWLTYLLGRGLFEPRVGWVAAVAVLVSLPLWREVLVLNGTPLLMVLSLAAFLAWRQVDLASEVADAGDGERGAGNARVSTVRTLAWLATLGATCGLLFLCEYSAGMLVLVALGYATWRFQGRRRWVGLLGVVAGFVVIVGPWVTRNVQIAGNPVGLAAQNIALKAGDPTAEPASVRATLAPDGPAINLRKLSNKTLTAVQQDLRDRVWSGGAMVLTAFFVAGWLYAFRSRVANRMRWTFTAAFAVLIVGQAALNSGESERLAVVWLAPVMMVFGAGFFFVLLGSNETLGRWPFAMAAVLLVGQAMPLAHDALAPAPAVRFQYPPYFPALFRGMRQEIEQRGALGQFGVMADVPAGVAWYGGVRVWEKPATLHDFYAVTLRQPIGELLLTPRTLDRPFFTELNARPVVPGSLGGVPNRVGDWGEIYAGLLTGSMPGEFPLRFPRKIAENLFVLLNPALPPIRGK